MRALFENWRYSISFAWHCLDKGALVVYSMLPLPFVFLGVLGYVVTQDYREAMALDRGIVAGKAIAAPGELLVPEG